MPHLLEDGRRPREPPTVHKHSSSDFVTGIPTITVGSPTSFPIEAVPAWAGRSTLALAVAVFRSVPKLCCRGHKFKTYVPGAGTGEGDGVMIACTPYSWTSRPPLCPVFTSTTAPAR